VPLDDLAALDGRLMDGLEFCRAAYDALEAIKAEPGGITELQGSTSRRAKKLLEEILPLAAFIQARYGPGSRMQVRWSGGSQPYDAQGFYRGGLVDRGFLPAEQYLEITTAEPVNEYLVRERMAKHGGSFATAGTRRDPVTREVLSDPVAVEHSEEMDGFVRLILERVQEKVGHGYPENTALVVHCNLGEVILEDDWAYIVGAIRRMLHGQSLLFTEVVLVHHANGVARVGERASEGGGPTKR
jgi:hypothetical protein